MRDIDFWIYEPEGEKSRLKRGDILRGSRRINLNALSPNRIFYDRNKATTEMTWYNDNKGRVLSMTEFDDNGHRVQIVNEIIEDLYLEE